MRIRSLAIILLLAACTGDPAGIDPADVVMTVSVDAGAPPTQHNVEVVVENRAGRTVYVGDHCGDVMTPRFERRAGGTWVDAPYGPVPCLAVVTPPIELAPGATVVRSLRIDQPGRYRSTVRITSGPDEEIAKVSHEFTVGS